MLWTVEGKGEGEWEGGAREACCVKLNWPKTNFELQIVVTCAQTAPKECAMH